MTLELNNPMSQSVAHRHGARNPAITRGVPFTLAAKQVESSFVILAGGRDWFSRARLRCLCPLQSLGIGLLAIVAIRRRGDSSMMARRFIMNAGRTTKQGQQINIGKDQSRISGSGQHADHARRTI